MCRKEHFNKFLSVRRYNAKIKVYPDGTKVATFCNKFIFAPSEPSRPSSKKKSEPKKMHIEFRKYCGACKPVGFSHFGISFVCSKSVFTAYSYLPAYTLCCDDIYSSDVETFGKKDKPDKPKKRRSDNVRRTQQKLYDLVAANEWKYFFTGTFGNNSFDVTSAKEALKPLQNWLKDMVKRKGLKYVLVAEYQKNGRIHFHGFINDALEMVDSGTRKIIGSPKEPPHKISVLKRMGIPESKWQICYNIPDWKFGFTTAFVPEGNGLFKYITKYVTKDSKAIFGRYYWSSRNLVREVPTEYRDVDFDKIAVRTYTVPRTDIELKYYTFFPGQTDFHYNAPCRDSAVGLPSIHTLIERFKEYLKSHPNSFSIGNLTERMVI